MLEERVLWKIYAPRTDNINAEFRTLHKELGDLYSSPRTIRIMGSRILL